MNLEDIRNELEKTGNPETVSVALAIVEYLAALPKSESHWLSYGMLQQALQRPRIDLPLIAAINALSQRTDAWLKRRIVFVDFDGEEFEFSEQDYEQAIIEGAFVHPVYGDVVPRHENRIYPIYALTQSYLGKTAYDS